MWVSFKTELTVLIIKIVSYEVLKIIYDMFPWDK